MLDGAGGTSAQRGDEFEVFEFLVASSRFFGWIEGFATSDRRRVAPLLSSADEHHIRVNAAESGAGKGIDKNFSDLLKSGGQVISKMWCAPHELSSSANKRAGAEKQMIHRLISRMSCEEVMGLAKPWRNSFRALRDSSASCFRRC